ncbi:S8 family peptidase [Microseira sp. BLCC-F43]|jgi:subtilisin family serine protease|uniref:S8 family peptidase n=1 Tax=Microseira sp. BLCC-F43 TaxID=3153602 RepID=UPI0035B760BA
MSTISSSTSQPIALENLFYPDFYDDNSLDLAGFSDWQALQQSRNYSLAAGENFSPLVDSKGVLTRLNYPQSLDRSGSDQLDKTSAFIDLNLAKNNNIHLINQPLSFGLNQGQAASRLVEERQNFSSSGLNEKPALSQHPFNSNFGYGLVDAAGAVAAAIGRSPFAEVSALGGNNWGLDAIKAPEVWHQGYTGQGTVVAVIDTGVDYTHRDLDNNIWVNPKEIPGNNLDDDGNGFVDDVRGWDFVNDDSAPMDEQGHGTHVAGIIAAENNGFGTTGVAFNAKIMPVRVLGESGGSQSDIAAGIRYAVDNGADVINLSLGGDFTSAQEANAIRYAAEKGVVVVMAAGNESKSQPVYPARYSTNYGIAVGAVNRNNQMPGFCNKAGTTELDYVVAPGVNIYSTWTGNNYEFATGTSMASPYVAGVAALILSANPNLSPAQVETILTSTANSTIVQSAGANSTAAKGLKSSAAMVDSLTGNTIDADFDSSSLADAAAKDFNLDPVTCAAALKHLLRTGGSGQNTAENEIAPNTYPQLLANEISPGGVPCIAANFKNSINLPLETGVASIPLDFWDNSTGYIPEF